MLGIFLLLIAGVSAAGVGVLFYQGTRPPVTDGEYVALGSSFAAGLGLGARAPDSPYVCQRSVNGYPHQLARMTGLRLVDRTCSGATISNVLRGGQVFQGPQLDAIGAKTKVVTLTAGGNDIAYIGDLTGAAFINRGGIKGFIARIFWNGMKKYAERNFDSLEREFVAALLEIRRRAPQAQVLVVTYPRILPASGACANLGLSASEADTMRQVAERLGEISRTAAQTAGVTVIDVHALSAGHDACATDAWVNGVNPPRGAPFHPTLPGARAVAAAISSSLSL